ncbi:MAG TPA: RES family NAD+ phosphorylase [Methylomirabilota bacterium]|nr:RES family NAD+ phosphorylase [Methylomirabilota bacterium]
MTLTGWRIVPAEAAAGAFNGEGARLYGGRWNPVGIPIVYGSQHQSLAALELRVHIDKTRMRKPYLCFKFHFDDSLLEKLSLKRLPKNWRDQPPPPSLQAIGRDWVSAGSSLVLAVPSIIIPSELNYLINPRHREIRKLRIDPPTPFAFDQRLFA